VTTKDLPILDASFNIVSDDAYRARLEDIRGARPPAPERRPLYRADRDFDHTRPTKRGWLFMGNHGGPCDKACKHCYYAFQKQLVFYDLNTLIAHANRMRHYYDLRYCDISGGEATIYGPKDKAGRRPHLEALIRHCANIGLKPTIITHGQNSTPELVKGVEDAGLEDWLISMHGMSAGHDNLVVNHNGQGQGGWERLTANLKNITRPARFNSTIQAFNYRELSEQARWLADNMPPTVFNMIQFNPFFAWAGKEVIEFQEKMSVLAPFVAEAVHIAEAAGWEVNVRYFSPCVAAEYGFARNCIGYFQTQIDPWEWSLVATEKAPMAAIREMGSAHDVNMAMCRAISDSRANDVCRSCRFFGTACEGPPEQYQARFGLDELRPSVGEPVTDPAYFELEAL
jgi:hypothetical protein